MRKLSVVVLLTVVVIAGCAGTSAPPTSRLVTQEQFASVELGMSKARVFNRVGPSFDLQYNEGGHQIWRWDAVEGCEVLARFIDGVLVTWIWVPNYRTVPEEG